MLKRDKNTVHVFYLLMGTRNNNYRKGQTELENRTKKTVRLSDDLC